MASALLGFFEPPPHVTTMPQNVVSATLVPSSSSTSTTVTVTRAQENAPVPILQPAVHIIPQPSNPFLPGTTIPLVRLTDADVISDEVAARLATSLLGHVLFLKGQIPLPVQQLGRMPPSKGNPRATKRRLELLNSFDTLSSHLSTTFTSLSFALAKASRPQSTPEAASSLAKENQNPALNSLKATDLSTSDSAPLPSNPIPATALPSPKIARAYVAILVGPSLTSAKTKIILGLDSFCLKDWEEEDESVDGEDQDGSSEDDEGSHRENEVSKSNIEDEKEDSEEDSEEEATFASGDESAPHRYMQSSSTPTGSPSSDSTLISTGESNSPPKIQSTFIIARDPVSSSPPRTPQQPSAQLAGKNVLQPSSELEHIPTVFRDEDENIPPQSPTSQAPPSSPPALPSISARVPLSSRSPPPPTSSESINSPLRSRSNIPSVHECRHPNRLTHTAMQHKLHLAERLLARTLALSDAQGNEESRMAAEMAPTQIHILVRAPRSFDHPAWIPRQNVSSSLDSALGEFMETSSKWKEGGEKGEQVKEDDPESSTKKGFRAINKRVRGNKVDAIWVVPKDREPEFLKSLSGWVKNVGAANDLDGLGAGDDDAGDMIWWSWDGKLVGFADW